jgi:hypothetical protein
LTPGTWAIDINCNPLQKGFLCLVAMVDLFSRNVHRWRLSNRLDTGHGVLS